LDLEQALATFSDDLRDDVGDGGDPGPYSIEGIAFSALVSLVRIENDSWGWTPEDLRALGLDAQRHEELTWLDAEHAEITDSSGGVRYRYRQ
jgi:hypothetical protein